MNTNLLLILFALLALAALTLPTLFQRACKKSSYRSQRRSGLRPLTRWERCSIPFVLAMSVLATRFNNVFGTGDRVVLANLALTMPTCGDTSLADEAIGRFALVKIGTDVYHKGLCDKGDIPAGFTRDASAAIGERFAFDYFGLAHKGTQATASGAVTAGHIVCPGDDGTIRDITLVTTETVYACGLAVSTAATGNAVVFIPFAPVKTVIA